MTMEEAVNMYTSEMHAGQEIYFTRDAGTVWFDTLPTFEGCGPYELGVEVIDFDEDGAFLAYSAIRRCDGPKLDQVLLDEIAAKATKDHALSHAPMVEDDPECPF